MLSMSNQGGNLKSTSINGYKTYMEAGQNRSLATWLPPKKIRALCKYKNYMERVDLIQNLMLLPMASFFLLQVIVFLSSPRFEKFVTKSMSEASESKSTSQLSIDLRGKRAFIAGVADANGYGWAIAKSLAAAGAEILVGTWVPVSNVENETLPDVQIRL